MADVVVFGCGQLAEIALFYLRELSDHRVVALTVDREYLTADTAFDLPVVAWEDVPKDYPPGEVSLFAPISYQKVNNLRKSKFQEGKAQGYRFISFVHPNATYYGTPVGENCFIFEDNTIQPFARIGDDVILWSGNHVGHHTVIEDHVFVASHVVISGSVTVGERCFLGVNATIRDNVALGEACVVGAGALVLGDLAAETVVPARASEAARIPSSKLRRI